MNKIAIASLLSLGAFAAQAETTYPYILQNCGQSVTFETKPETAVSVGQATTEILYALGLDETNLLGTGVWFDDVAAEYAAVNAKVDRLADNDPSFESIVGKRPDLVTIEYEWHIGPDGMIATRDQFHDLGIDTYVLPTDCVGKDNSEGVDGTRSVAFSTSSIYQGISEIADIFNISAEGDALVARLQDREVSAIERAKALNIDDASAVVWYSSVDLESDPYVAGQKGAPAYMLSQLGMRNVVQSDEEWPLVGWETIIKSDPSFIVIAKMERRRFDGDDVAKKLEFLKTDPVASQMTAVKEDRIIVLDVSQMNATMRLISGLETLTDALEAYENGQQG
ncbi:ABC transporter substrate-binding protein [Shimia haliotis]|uniref:Iron complex transport system substrate-binding protein n=1 Tax=Shimia haliotis TaxID=1280847 RepID=A0A1I4AZG2_9RHOB|nr:ABC transporter substrate-binding protein [Shimia haliotis]SFK61297.1 iron complex transport system substrate-binding protein [Shimia haliotis]